MSLKAGQKQRKHSVILSTSIKLPVVIKIFVLSIFEWPFYTCFTVRSAVDDNVACAADELKVSSADDTEDDTAGYTSVSNSPRLVQQKIIRKNCEVSSYRSMAMG